jgi:hypothetical protein
MCRCPVFHSFAVTVAYFPHVFLFYQSNYNILNYGVNLSFKVLSCLDSQEILIFCESLNFISKFIRATTEPRFESENLIHTFTPLALR